MLSLHFACSQLNCGGCGDIGHGVMIRLSDSCRHLRELRLSGSPSLLDESLMLLARRSCTEELEVLDVRGCVQLSSASIEFLAKASPCLSWVYLDGLPKVKTEHLRQLRSLFPLVRFFFCEINPKVKGVPTYRGIASNKKKSKKAKS
ncbi:hypothetical protein Efla_004742 [Eimeria flavescens]